MSVVLAVDCETTGLDSAKDDIIEIGAVLWDVNRKMSFEHYSTMIYRTVPVPPEITTLTGITSADLSRGTLLRVAIQSVCAMALRADYYCAHNAPFDRAFLERAASELEAPWPALPWIDTKEDLPLPPSTTSRKLAHLCADHGLHVSKTLSHRALFDALAVAELLSCYDFDAVAARAASPAVLLVGKQAFEENSLAKQNGFRWNGERKRWERLARECDLPLAVPFRYAQEAVP